MVATRSATEPARCAGLRRTLLHGWEQGFPLQDSPFQVLARQTGGTLREVLGQCHALAGAGALDGIRVHWGAALQRVRWRCGVALAGIDLPRLLDTLAALPGVASWERLEPVHAPGPAAVAGRASPPGQQGGPFDGPTLWFEIVARSRPSAQAQRAAVESLGLHLLTLELEGGDAEAACTCAARGGPCSDPALARRCESGLPLVAHPYRCLSEAVQRSEREVLSSLRRWQRAGLLHSVGLTPPVTAAESPWSLSALAGDPIDERSCADLLAQPGIAEVQALPGHVQWPYRLLVATPGAPTPADALLERALKACGLQHRPRRRWHMRRVRQRSAPLLFADGGPPDG